MPTMTYSSCSSQGSSCGYSGSSYGRVDSSSIPARVGGSSSYSHSGNSSTQSESDTLYVVSNNGSNSDPGIYDDGGSGHYDPTQGINSVAALYMSVPECGTRSIDNYI